MSQFAQTKPNDESEEKDTVDIIIRNLCDLNLYEHAIGQANLLRAMTNVFFPTELILSPSEYKIAPTLEASICLYLLLSTDTRSDYASVPWIPLIFDPDLVAVHLLKALKSKSAVSSDTVRLVQTPLP